MATLIPSIFLPFCSLVSVTWRHLRLRPIFQWQKAPRRRVCAQASSVFLTVFTHFRSVPRSTIKCAVSADCMCAASCQLYFQMPRGRATQACLIFVYSRHNKPLPPSFSLVGSSAVIPDLADVDQHRCVHHQPWPDVMVIIDFIFISLLDPHFHSQCLAIDC